MERGKIYKSVAVSIFWMLITLVVLIFIYDYAMCLMSLPSTFSFVSGLSISVVAIVLFVFIIHFQIFKIKRAFKKKSSDEPKEEPTKEESSN